MRVVDWYDGPIAGLCRVGGVSLWFVLDDEVRVPGTGKRRRSHCLYQISDAEVARIEGGEGGEFPALGALVGVWHEGAGVVPAEDVLNG